MTGSPRPLAARWLPQPRPISPGFSSTLDFMRWLAAFHVCITHVRSLVITDHASGGTDGVVAKVFFALHGLGHGAVMVFFLISGYLVGGEVMRGFARGDFSWRGYFIRRVARLYTVYVAALVIGGVLDATGVHAFAATGLYHQASDSPMIYYNVSERLGLATLLGNLGFCQEILVPTWGSNVPLWSLANEAWYYLLFPLALAAAFDPRPGRRWFALAGALAVAWFIRGEILLYFTIWLAGTVPHFLPKPVLRSCWPVVLALLAVMFAIRFRWIGADVVYYGHLLIAALGILLLNNREYLASRPLPGATWHRRLAGFSYSLYLLHWPLAMFLTGFVASWLHFGLREPVTFAGVSWYALLLLAIYAASSLLAFLTEKRTPAVRNWLDRTLPPRRPGAS